MKQSLSQTLITGGYRTGSEYIAHIIDCHPEISVSMYRINVLRFIYNRFNPIHQKERYIAALDAITTRLEHRYWLQLPKNDVIRTLSDNEPMDYGKFYDIIMTHLYLGGQADHWAEKNQLLWREIPLFLDMMPNGRAVLIIRDPRAILLSFKHFTYAAPPAYLEAAFNAFDAMKHGLQYEKQYPTRFYCVRFEDAVRNPELIAQNIWRFLGVEGTYDVRDQSGWKDAYGNPWFGNSAFQNNTQRYCFDIEKNINGWENQLTDDEIAFIELICKDVMEPFGYHPVNKTIDPFSLSGLLGGNDSITGYYQNWLSRNEGIEAFPTDPLNSKNWRKRGTEPIAGMNSYENG